MYNAICSGDAKKVARVMPDPIAFGCPLFNLTF